MAEKKDYINITDDGGIKKRIIIEGNGEKPILGDKIFIKYIEKRIVNKIPIESKKVSTIFILGHRVIKGWEIGIKTMKLNEKAEFVLSPKYTNLSFRKSINYDTIYEIELIKFEKTNNYLTERIYKRQFSQYKVAKKEEKIRIYTNNIKINDSRNKKKNIYENYKSNIIKKSKIISKSLDKKKEEKIINKKRKLYGFNYYEIIKMKSDSPICDKCFRFRYISFDFIENYISTKCSYCNKIDIFKYDVFLEVIKSNKNPLLNSYCYKCKSNFLFSKSSFYLLENLDFTFFVICENCFKNHKNKEYKKKIILKDLINHNLYLYEKNKDLDKLKLLEIEFMNNKMKLQKDLKIFENYEQNLLLIGSLMKNTPLSLRQKAEKKLNIFEWLSYFKSFKKFHSFGKLLKTYKRYSFTSNLNLIFNC